VSTELVELHLVGPASERAGAQARPHGGQDVLDLGEVVAHTRQFFAGMATKLARTTWSAHCWGQVAAAPCGGPRGREGTWMTPEDRPEQVPLRDGYDVVVVGGGAAGLSGALTLARALRSVLVVDAGSPRNAPAAGVHNYLGREGMPPGELLAQGRREVRG
jgi:hypothetical protein